MYNQEYYEAPQGPTVRPRACPSCLPDARALSFEQACERARWEMCWVSKGVLKWCDPSYLTCEQVQQHICADDCSVFVGDHPTRMSLCCSPTCPAPQPWASPTYECPGGQPPTCPVGTEWDGSKCVPTPQCPPGTEWDGSKCVPIQTGGGGSLLLGLGAIAACTLGATVLIVSSRRRRLP